MAAKGKKHYFLKSFSYTLIVVFVLAFIVVLTATPWMITGKARSESSIISNDSRPHYDPENLYGFSLLLTLSKNKDSSPYSYFLVAFNAARSKVTVVNLPVETVLITKDSQTSLDDLYDVGGAAHVMAACNEYFNITLNRYIRFDQASLAGLVDLLEDVIIDIPYQLNQVDKKNDIYIRIEQGKQYLDGILFIDLMNFTQWKEGRIQAYYQNALAFSELLNQKHLDFSHAESEKVFSFLVNSCSTNLSYQDLENRRDTLEYLFYEKKPASPLRIMGEFQFNESEFHLNETTKLSITAAFSGVGM